MGRGVQFAQASCGHGRHWSLNWIPATCITMKRFHVQAYDNERDRPVVGLQAIWVSIERS